MKAWTQGLLLVVGLSGCSSEPRVENLESVAQPFDASSCATAAADASFVARFNGIGGASGTVTASPDSYATCFRGYVVDVTNLGSEYATPTGHFNVTWVAGTEPTSQTQCEHAWGGVIFYERSSGTWIPAAPEIDVFGTWSGGHCTGPNVSSASVMSLVSGGSYRVAATMRNILGGSILHPIQFYLVP